MHDPDERLRAASAGDGDAQSALWREHRRWVAAVLLAHAPRGSDLDDLLQEVAVRFVANLRTLRDPQALRPWLRTIAVHVARSAARVRPPAAPWSDTSAEGAADLAHARDREREAARDRLQAVLEALARMHPDYREPMWLRAVQGLGQAEIAAILGLPITTVETRLARGRRMLRAAFTPERAPSARPEPIELPPP